MKVLATIWLNIVGACTLYYFSKLAQSYPHEFVAVVKGFGLILLATLCWFFTAISLATVFNRKL